MATMKNNTIRPEMFAKIKFAYHNTTVVSNDRTSWVLFILFVCDYSISKSSFPQTILQCLRAPLPALAMDDDTATPQEKKLKNYYRHHS